MDGKHVVFGEVLSGKSIVRKIENLPTQGSDKPAKDVTITNCGQLTGEEADVASQQGPDKYGDSYEDFPEDMDKELALDEILKIATDLKTYGNAAFKANDLSAGLDKYQKGMRYLDQESKYQSETEVRKLKFTLCSNSALLSNKLKAYDDGLRYATDALDLAINDENVSKKSASFHNSSRTVTLKAIESDLFGKCSCLYEVNFTDFERDSLAPTRQRHCSGEQLHMRD